MDAMIRLCIVHVDTMFTLTEKVPSRKVTNIKPVLEGNLGSEMNFAIEVFWFEGLNYTADRVESTQECVTLISRNESDYCPVPVESPVNEDYYKVNLFTIIAQSTMSMVQAYNRTDKSTMKTDLFITAINGLNWQVWLALILQLVSIVFLLKIRQKFLKKPFLSPRRLDIRRRKWINCRDDETSDAFFHVISTFCQQASKKYRDTFLNVITFWVYVASFFLITCYFSNVMSTDMIVVNKPDVIKTYDEVFEKGNVIPTFTRQVSDYKHFEDAINGSREHEFWKKLKEKFDDKDILVDVRSKVEFVPFLQDLCSRRRLVMLNSIIEQTIRATICKTKEVLAPNVLAYAPVDPWSGRFAKGLVVRKTTDSPIITRITLKMHHLFDMGITDHAMKESAKGKLSKDILPEDPPDLRDCMSTTLVIEDPGFQAASDNNFKSIAQLSFLLILVATVCLISEFVMRKFKK